MMQALVEGARARYAVFLAENQGEAVDFLGEVWLKSARVGKLSWRLVVAVFSLLRLVGVPLCKRTASTIASQPAEWLLAEAIALAILGLLVWFRRWLKRSPLVRRLKLRFYRARARVERFQKSVKDLYERTLKSVAEKSRLAAAMLPHLGYFGAVFAVRRFLLPRSSRALFAAPQFAACILVYQLVVSDVAARAAARAVAQHATGAAAPKPVASPSTRTLAVSTNYAVAAANSDLRQVLKFWAIFGFGVVLIGGLHAAPYGGDLWRAAPDTVRNFLLEARGVLLLWLQLPLLEATDASFRSLRLIALWAAPSLVAGTAASNKRRDAKRWHKVDAALSTAQNALSLLAPSAVTSKLGLLKRYVLEIVLDGDSWVVLAVAAVGFCTIGPPARLGALAVGFALPVLSTVRLVGDVDEDPRRAQRVLGYWIVLATREIVGLNESVARLSTWIPLKSQLEIALCLWLQLPYTRGAEKVRSKVERTCALYLDRFKDA